MAFGAALLTATLTVAELDEDRHERHGGEHPRPAEDSDPARALSPELRQLLVKEMQLIDDGMGELLSAISSGNWKTVEAIAGKIQHSFILKQQLTDQQLHELHEKLPGEFVRMDVRFHETAGKLAAITHHRDAELATFYYSRLVDGCVSCHASFAPQRFPGLARDKPGEHEH
jgi:hypothetical protein